MAFNMVTMSFFDTFWHGRRSWLKLIVIVHIGFLVFFSSCLSCAYAAGPQLVIESASGLSIGISASRAEIQKILPAPLKIQDNKSELITLNLFITSKGTINKSGGANLIMLMAPAIYRTNKHDTELAGWYLISAFSSTQKLIDYLEGTLKLSPINLAKISGIESPGDLNKIEIIFKDQTLFSFKKESGAESAIRYNFYIFNNQNGKIKIVYFNIKGTTNYLDKPTNIDNLTWSKLVSSDLLEKAPDPKLNNKTEWVYFFNNADINFFEPNYFSDKFLK